jgi:hypothetical protein
MTSKNLPEVLQYDFLNQSEIIDIKNKVLELKSLWQYLHHTTNKNLNSNVITTQMLSPGMYSRQHFAYMISVKKFKPIMKEQFNTYYNKIKTKIEQVYNKPVIYLDKANYPGFHIYELSGNQSVSKYDCYNFHKDNFSYLSQITTPGSIVSMIIPISLPVTGGSLLYKTSDVTTRFEYSEGMVAQWGSQILHSIEPFSLTQNECRITMQMHLNIRENEIAIFW